MYLWEKNIRFYNIFTLYNQTSIMDKIKTLIKLNEKISTKHT